MAYPFDKEARSPESTDVVSPLGHAESFRIPRKSVGASKTDSFTKEWPIKGDENGVSPPESPGRGKYEPLHHDGPQQGITPSSRHSFASRVSHTIRWWRFEIFACFVTAACLAGQAVALAYVDGKPQDAWGNDVLTLNGFIAILSTLHRMSLTVVMGAAIAQTGWIRFAGSNRERPSYPLADFVTLRDTANGSIQGSLKVLWRFKGRHIACLGGLLVILCLGIDAFYQQLIDLRVDLVPDTSSEAPVLNVDRAHWVDSVHGFSNAWMPSRATKLAMYSGFIAPTVDVPSAVCPTGNCTWPIVPTIGVCGACVNMTDEIRIVNQTAPKCVVTTRSGLELTGNCQIPDYGTVFTLGPGSNRVFSENSSPAVIKRKGKPDLPVPSADANNVITQFGAVGVPSPKLPAGLLNESIAAECAMWYCLQAHNVSVRAGKISDEVVEIWSKASIKEQFGDGSGQNVTFNDIPKSFNTEGDVAYGLGPFQMYAMREYTNETIIGNVSADGTAGVVAPSTDFVEGLHSSFHDIDNWMDRLTLSMTNEIRINQGRDEKTRQEPEERYASTVFINQVTTVVRWEWITFPAAITFLAIVYMIVEIVRTEYSGAEAWKQDEFMPLCLTMDDNEVLKEIRMGQQEPEGLKKRIGRVRVGLQRRDGNGDRGPLGLARVDGE